MKKVFDVVKEFYSVVCEGMTSKPKAIMYAVWCTIWIVVGIGFLIFANGFVVCKILLFICYIALAYTFGALSEL